MSSVAKGKCGGMASSKYFREGNAFPANNTSSGGFRPGPKNTAPPPVLLQPPPSFVDTQDFCKDNKKSDFLHYQILEMWAILQLPSNAKKPKVL